MSVAQARPRSRGGMSPFLTRIAVIVAGLPLVLFAAYYGGWALLALLAPATLLALHELYRMARALRPLVLAGYAGSLAAVLGAYFGGPEWMVGGFALTLLLAFLFAAISETSQSSTVAVATTVLGAAWVGLGLASLVLVRDLEPEGRLVLITVLLTVFVADTFAYLGGRVAGRHKMAPAISPGKTWEGFVIGAIAGVVTTWLALNDDHAGIIGWEAFVLGAVIVLAGVSGDLFESMVKRDLGVKDSSRVLLGHGGVLDRVDSMVFAGPAAYFAVLALTQS
jgi:phosphatidate cytidylyltransferase